MIDFSIGKYNLFIKVFPVWIYVEAMSNLGALHVEFGIFNICFGSTISVDKTMWDK